MGKLRYNCTLKILAMHFYTPFKYNKYFTAFSKINHYIEKENLQTYLLAEN